MPDAIPQLADLEWLRRRYCDDRATMVEIADELGCTQPAVTKALARAGIKARPKGRPPQPKETTAPWDFSTPPAEGEAAVRNLPTPEGRALGAEMARLTGFEEARLRERFPNHQRRCGDCALRAGTDPNGCAETLMDVVKGLVEGVPFFCHKALAEDGSPRLLCAGYAILSASEGPAAVVAGERTT